MFDLGCVGSDFTHIAFEITNENDYTLKDITVSMSVSLTNVTTKCYTELEPGQSGVFFFPVSKLGNNAVAAG